MINRILYVLLVAMIAPSLRAETFFVHADHLGTPQALTDANGTVVWRAHYEPFGHATVDAGSTVTFNLRFPGQYFDAGTGLHYNYYRDYDPDTGRYLQPDPIGIAGGLNPYVYAYDNPLRFADPTGEAAIAIVPLLKAIAAATTGFSAGFGGTRTYQALEAAGLARDAYEGARDVYLRCIEDRSRGVSCNCDLEYKLYKDAERDYLSRGADASGAAARTIYRDVSPKIPRLSQ